MTNSLNMKKEERDDAENYIAVIEKTLCYCQL